MKTELQVCGFSYFRLEINDLQVFCVCSRIHRCLQETQIFYPSQVVTQLADLICISMASG
jgi:hypothetical protein